MEPNESWIELKAHAPKMVAELRFDKTVTWFDMDRYRLATDPVKSFRDASKNNRPQPKTGSRGGQYTEATTKEGRRYRRYF